MPTISDLYKTEYKKLLTYYSNKQLALSVFKFVYEYTFGKQFFLVDNHTIFSKKKRIEFIESIYQITELHIPFQYILKEVPFLNTRIKVSPPILIPRPETEWWTEFLIKKLQTKKDTRLYIADFCSGSGCIGIALLTFFDKSFCDSFDILPQAINLASENANLNKVRSRYKVYLKNILKLKKHKKYDIIVSNPPYIPLEAYQELDPSVKNWEDMQSLTDGGTGYSIILHIIKYAQQSLKKNSILCIEICESYAKFLLTYSSKLYPTDFVFLLEDQYNKKRVLIIVKGEYKKFFENIYETH